MKKPGQHRIAFTRELWDKWLARLNAPPPKQTEHLQAGIERFRKLCAFHERGEDRLHD